MSLFKVLELDENCNNSEQIKLSYFRLAKKWHPDVNSSAEAAIKFKEISHAYDTLKDDVKRRNYQYKFKTEEFHVSSNSSYSNVRYSYPNHYNYKTKKFFHFSFFNLILNSQIIIFKNLIEEAILLNYS
jgi:DnaJ-class molecular chaperone